MIMYLCAVLCRAVTEGVQLHPQTANQPTNQPLQKIVLLFVKIDPPQHTTQSPTQPQDAQAASLAAEVAALRCSESRLSAELASAQAALADSNREAGEVKRALAAARDAEQDRLVLEVYPLMRARYILAAAAGEGVGGDQGGLGVGWVWVGCVSLLLAER